VEGKRIEKLVVTGGGEIGLKLQEYENKREKERKSINFEKDRYLISWV
jgi:hypothetical protein